MPNCNKKHPSELTVQQLNAIDALVSGVGVAKTAEMLGLNRHTVSRWKSKHPYFIARLNETRKEKWSEAHERLRGMVDKALNVMESALDSGDSRVAVEVLKAVNIYGNVHGPNGSTNSEAVIGAMAKKYANELLISPASSDPQTVLHIAEMLPVITMEIYQDMKDNIQNYIQEDDDGTGHMTANSQ